MSHGRAEQLDDLRAPGGIPAPGEIAQLAAPFLRDAVQRQASDIHVNCLSDGILIRFRVNGVLQDVDTLSSESGRRLVHHLKAISGMNIIERRRPQDGRVVVDMEGGEVDFRLASIDALWGENLSIRIFDKRGCAARTQRTRRPQ